MNDILEFIDSSHTYLYNGIPIPSVSSLVEFQFPNLYSDVPKYILKNKANYGTKVHKLIEMYLNNEYTIDELGFMRIDPTIKSSIKQFIKLKNTNFKFDVKETETMVCYEGKYAGRFDILTTNNYIIDIKTTSGKTTKDLLDSNNDEALEKGIELNYDKPLNLQISLYYLAKGIEKDFGYLLWMPKDNLVQIDRVKTWPKYKLMELLESYEQKNESFTDI